MIEWEIICILENKPLFHGFENQECYSSLYSSSLTSSFVSALDKERLQVEERRNRGDSQRRDKNKLEEELNRGRVKEEGGSPRVTVVACPLVLGKYTCISQTTNDFFVLLSSRSSSLPPSYSLSPSYVLISLAPSFHSSFF